MSWFCGSTRQIIEEALKWRGVRYLSGGTTRGGIDCSHFVWQVYNNVVDGDIPLHFFTNSKNDGQFFYRVDKDVVKKGDLICWGNDHIGIVTDPNRGNFIGAQTSTGVAIASYRTGSWAHKPHYFLRYKFILFAESETFPPEHNLAPNMFG